MRAAVLQLGRSSLFACIHRSVRKGVPPRTRAESQAISHTPRGRPEDPRFLTRMNSRTYQNIVLTYLRKTSLGNKVNAGLSLLDDTPFLIPV